MSCKYLYLLHRHDWHNFILGKYEEFKDKNEYEDMTESNTAKETVGGLAGLLFGE
jgi:hypothetical protein